MPLTQLPVAVIVLDESSIDKCLDRLKDGLVKYLWIQSNFININVSQDIEFQRKFNHFYRLRRNELWRNEFYLLLEKSKNTKPSFETILLDLYKKTGRVEASFASKLAATVNPSLPIIDSVVLRNLGMKLPISPKNRFELIGKVYSEMEWRLNEILKSDIGIQAISKFQDRYPAADITNIKILDLILWQLRV